MNQWIQFFSVLFARSKSTLVEYFIILFISNFAFDDNNFLRFFLAYLFLLTCFVMLGLILQWKWLSFNSTRRTLTVTSISEDMSACIYLILVLLFFHLSLLLHIWFCVRNLKNLLTLVMKVTVQQYTSSLGSVSRSTECLDCQVRSRLHNWFSRYSEWLDTFRDDSVLATKSLNNPILIIALGISIPLFKLQLLL